MSHSMFAVMYRPIAPIRSHLLYLPRSSFSLRRQALWRSLQVRPLAASPLLLSLLCLLALSACAQGTPDAQQAAQTLPVLGSIPQLAQYHVFVTDLGTGDFAELGKGTVNGGESLHGLARSPDRKIVYATDIADNRLDFFDITGAAPRLLRTVTVGLFPVHLAFTQDGRIAYVTNFQGASVSVVDTTKDKVIATIKTPTGPHGLTVSPDGRFVYVACLDGQALAIIDTATNTLAQTLMLPADVHPYSLVLGKEGRYLYVTDNFFGRVIVVDTQKLDDPAHALVGDASAGQQPALIAIAPDGKHLYVTDSVGTLAVLDLASGPTRPKLIATVPVGQGAHGVAVSPDGRYVIVANVYAGTLSVLDTTTNRVIATIKGEKHPNDVLITLG